MMALATIRELAAREARKAARLHKRPLLVESDDLLGDDTALLRHLHSMPFLGEYKPKGWHRVDLKKAHGLSSKARHYDALFIDSTGWGLPGEPALTMPEFCAAVRALGPGHGYGIAEDGQMQVSVYVYRPGVV